MRKLWNKPITVGNYFTVCGVIVGIYTIFLGGAWLQYRKTLKAIENDFTDNSTDEDNW